MCLVWVERIEVICCFCLSPPPHQGSSLRLAGFGELNYKPLSSFSYSMKQEEMLGLVDLAGILMNMYNQKKALLKQSTYAQ